MKPRKRLPANDHIEKPKEETMFCLICGKKKGMCSHTRSQPDRQRETMVDHQEPSSTSYVGMQDLIAMARLEKKKITGFKTLSSSTAISSGNNKQEDCQLERKNDAHNVNLMTSTPHNQDSHGGKDQEILTMKHKTLDELKTDVSHQDFTCLMSKKQRIDERAIANSKVVKFKRTKTHKNSSTQKTLGGQRSGHSKNYDNSNCKTYNEEFFSIRRTMQGRSDCCKTCNRVNCTGDKKHIPTPNGHRSRQYQGKIEDGPEKSALVNDKAVQEENQSAGIVIGLAAQAGSHQSKVSSKLLPRRHALGGHQRCHSDAPSMIEAPTTFGAIHSKKKGHHQLEHKSDAPNLITSTFHGEKHVSPKKRNLLYEQKQGSSYQHIPSSTSKEQRICERTEAQNKNGKSAAEKAINAKSRVGFDDKKRVNMVTSGGGCEYIDNEEVEDKSTRAPISKSNNKKIMATMKMASTKKEMAEGGTSGIDYKQNSSMTSDNDLLKCIGSEISALANDEALQAENRYAGSFTNLTRSVGCHPWNKSFPKIATWGHKRSRSGAPQGINHPTATTSSLAASQETIQGKTGSRKFEFALNDNKVQEMNEV